MTRPFIKYLWPAAVISLAACQNQTAHLPEPVANNAVAYFDGSIYSFAGLGASKAWTDVHARAFKCDIEKSDCEKLPPLPDGKGRLAATAQSVGDEIFIFGGYTVAEDHSEISTPEVFAFDPKKQSYERRKDIPVPVDDSVSFVYGDRYIYLISGWHKDTNVADVQIYDTHTDSWQRGTDWPGAPVFGHAGGGVGNVMVICDGVQIIPPKDESSRRTFETISACWRGEIDPENITSITWTRLPQLPGNGLYRMAAIGVPDRNLVIFAGGSDNAYNYNGIGYNKDPSAPSAHVWGYDTAAGHYVVYKDKPTPTMDHRGLISLGDWRFATLGGMGEGQTVLDSLDVFELR
ncbi:MAG: galactose oxidase [Litorimonas sp.]